MTSYSGYKRFFALLLLLCVCVTAANSCPNRKLITVETQGAIARLVDEEAMGSGHSVCLAGISDDHFMEVTKAGGNLYQCPLAVVYHLNFLNAIPGRAFYFPRTLRNASEFCSLSLFLKNEAFII